MSRIEGQYSKEFELEKTETCKQQKRPIQQAKCYKKGPLGESHFFFFSLLCRSVSFVSGLSIKSFCACVFTREKAGLEQGQG